MKIPGNPATSPEPDPVLIERGKPMLTAIYQNIHRSKLPQPGEIGHIVGLSTINPKRRCIVEAFLDNGQKGHFSGCWFQGIF